jgi:hypothetical protein
LNRIKKVLSRIEETGTDITAGYEAWFAIGCALPNEFGEEGREFYHLVSQNNPDYKEYKTDEQFDKCLKRSYGYNIVTFFILCKRI